MYRRILVPLDGSDLAELPLNYAMHLAAKSGAELVLLHVCSPKECHCDNGKCTISPIHNIYINHTTESVIARLKEVGSDNVKVSSAVKVGDPAIEILHHAEENDVDLIAMATHGRPGDEQWVMNSVSIKIHRCSKAPIRLVRLPMRWDSPPDEWPEKKILVLLDRLEKAEYMLPYIVKHAKIGSAEVTLIHINEIPLAPANYSEPKHWEETKKQENNHQQDQYGGYLGEVEKQLQNDGVTVKPAIFKSKDVNELVNFIEENHFNLVAMATNAHCGAGAWPIHSIEDIIINRTASPVLLSR